MMFAKYMYPSSAENRTSKRPGPSYPWRDLSRSEFLAATGRDCLL